MFLPCLPCCDAGNTSCQPGCTVPDTLQATLTSNGVAFANFAITPAETAELEGFFEGTYILDHYGSSTSQGFSSELYKYLFPNPPYDATNFSNQGIQFFWSCFGTGHRVFFSACSTTDTSIKRRLTTETFGSSPTGSPVSVVDYCSGSSLSASFTNAVMRFLPDTSCSSSFPGLGDRIVDFDVEVLVEP